MSLPRLALSGPLPSSIPAGLARQPDDGGVELPCPDSLIATKWGIGEATAASILATLCFNLLFLPPAGTLTIADPQNWVAFLPSWRRPSSPASFRPSAATQHRCGRAAAGSGAPLRAQPGAAAVGACVIDSGCYRAAYCRYVRLACGRALRSSDGQHFEGGRHRLAGVDNKLREVARQAVSQRDPSGAVISAIRLGGAPIGSLAMLGPEPSDTVLQSIANLAAIGLERALEAAAAARAEAARESSELRATILDALAHEFKTPLTSMKAATGDLLTSVAAPREHELVAIIDEELDRLQSTRERRRADAARGLGRLHGPPRPPSPRGYRRRGTARSPASARWPPSSRITCPLT